MLECVPDILTPAEVDTLRTAMRSAGFVDGRTTAGFRAKRVKKNEQLGHNLPDRDAMNRIVLDGLRNNAAFQRAAMPRTIQKPLFSRYREGMEYGLHVDDATMGPDAMRTDVSVTVFLSQPWDYEGGELEIHSPFGIEQVKYPAGAAVVYPSSTLHRVLPVTKGERLAAVTWVQSKIRDAGRREMIGDLDRVRRRLTEIDPESEETDLAFKCHANLLRLWIE